jgi:hypothetical protein
MIHALERTEEPFTLRARIVTHEFCDAFTVYRDVRRPSARARCAGGSRRTACGRPLPAISSELESHANLRTRALRATRQPT